MPYDLVFRKTDFRIMLNEKPIFINGFQRGGTNMFVNLIASHPHISTVGMEMHEVFYGIGHKPMSKLFNRFINLPLLLFSNNFYKISNLDPRETLPSLMTKYADLQLYMNKMLASENYRKANGQRYSLREVHATRIVVKNVNGAVLISNHLEKIYPDAVFISIVRNGFALCEGFVRRGWDVHEFGKLYKTVSENILSVSKDNPKHLVVKFEDLLADPEAMLDSIYKHVYLSPNLLTHFRMHDKAVMTKNGNREYVVGGKDRQEIWLPYSELVSYFRKDVNDNQINHLAEEDKHKFLSVAENVMNIWGYA